jgi:hypothetical protein
MNVIHDATFKLLSSTAGADYSAVPPTCLPPTPLPPATFVACPAEGKVQQNQAPAGAWSAVEASQSIQLLSWMHDSTVDLPAAVEVDGVAWPLGPGFEGITYSATRTRISFFVGSYDGLEVPDDGACYDGPTFLYSGGFAKAGVVVCNDFVTTHGLVESEAAELHIKQTTTPMSQSDFPLETAASADVAGLTFASERGTVIQADRVNTGQPASVRFTVGSVVALEASRDASGMVAYAESLIARAGLDVGDGALILPQVNGLPTTTGAQPGDLAYEAGPGWGRLYICVAPGTWRGVALQ